MDILFTHADVLIWLSLIIVFLVAEALTAALVSIWFAAGSLAAIIIAALGLPGWMQILVFLAVSGLVLLLAKPWIERAINQKTIKTNADRVIGSLANVVVDVDNLSASGQVEVFGQLWSALSESGERIPKGSVVRVKNIQGVKLIVESLKEVKN